MRRALALAVAVAGATGAVFWIACVVLAGVIAGEPPTKSRIPGRAT